MSKKRIGVLTSGGDCAGLNAVIRAIVHRAVIGYDWEVVGVKQGTYGLMQRPIGAIELGLGDVTAQMLRLGGTFLGTINHGNPFAYPMPDGSVKDRSDEVIEGYHQLGLDALICMGGDGSLKIMRQLAEKGNINLIAVPKTIDNDVGATENAIGFATAVDVATEALDRLQPTAASHSRVMILEVMGRDAGHIALATGIAGGADIILIPEINYSIDSIVKKIKTIKNDYHRNFALIVVAEAVKTEEGQPVQKVYGEDRIRYGGIGHYLGEQLGKRINLEIRVTVLGHVQRGSSPTPADRMLAQAFGVRAVDLIAEGKKDRMVAWQNRNIIDVPIVEGIESYHAVELNSSAVQTARGLGISFGDE